jgi:hypothetical protein
MSEQSAESEQFTAVMVRQYTLGSISFMTDAWGNPGPPLVTVELRPTEIIVTETSRGQPGKWIGDGRTLRYGEIKAAQAIVNSRSYLVRGADLHNMPFGVRLYLGESRSHMLLFTTAWEALLHALAQHYVPIDENPRKLGVLLMGRK